FVSHAAGRMFVHQRTRVIGKLEYIARIAHGDGEGGGFGRVEAAKKDRHKKGGHLIIGDLAGSISGDNFFDLRGGEDLAVAFGFDKGEEAHGCGIWSGSKTGCLEFGKMDDGSAGLAGPIIAG